MMTVTTATTQNGEILLLYSVLPTDVRYGYCTTTIDGELLSSTFADSESEYSKNSSDGRPASATATAATTTTTHYVMNDGDNANIWFNINDTDGFSDTSKNNNGDDDDDSRRWFHSFTSIDGEKILIFRSKYRAQALVVLYQGSMVKNNYALDGSSIILYDDMKKNKNNNNINDDNGNDIEIFYDDDDNGNDNEDDLIPSTTTVQRTLSNTVNSLVLSLISSTTTVRRPPSSVPSLASGYSTTTIDGELILLFRSAYRVNGSTTIDGELILLFRSAYRVNGMYRTDTVLSSMLLQLQAKYKMIRHADHDTTSIMQLVVLYHDNDEMNMIKDPNDSIRKNGEYYVRFYCTNTGRNIKDYYQRLQSVTSTDGGLLLILLFRLAYRVDRMYRVDTDDPSLTSGYSTTSVVLLPLRSRLIHDDDDDTIAIMQLVVLNQDANNSDDDNTAIMQLLVLYQDKSNGYGSIISMQLVVLLQGIFNKIIDEGTDNTIDTVLSPIVLLLLFPMAYRVDRMYRVDDTVTITQPVLYQVKYEMIRPLQLIYHNNDDTITFATMQLVVLYQNKYHTIAVVSSLDRNGEYYKRTTLIRNIQDGIDGKEKSLEDKYQFRALHSQGQYKNEVYNAEEGMFQEPILRLDYYLLIILMYSFSRTYIGDGDETTTLISTNQNGEYKKIDDKKKRLDKYTLIYGHTISMIRLCLCFLWIVTMGLLVQSMGSVKIHKDRMNQVSQTRARLESTFGSTFGMRLRTSNPAYRVTCLYVLPYLSVCSFLLKENTTVKNCLMRRCTYGTLL